MITKPFKYFFSRKSKNGDFCNESSEDSMVVAILSTLYGGA
jgi:hypothetical protein